MDVRRRKAETDIAARSRQLEEGIENRARELDARIAAREDGFEGELERVRRQRPVAVVLRHQQAREVDLAAADVERDVVDRSRVVAGAPEHQVAGPQLAGRDRGGLLVLRDRVVRQVGPARSPGAGGQAGAVPLIRTGGAPPVGLPDLGAGERDRGLGARPRRRGGRWRSRSLRGLLGRLLGGLLYAVFWPAVYGEWTVLLEGLGTFCLLAALLARFRR